MKVDIYQKITDQIVRALETGTKVWEQPWSTDHLAQHVTRPRRANGIPYRGINILVLWSAAIERGYTSSHWLTFKQAIGLGAHVRKGEHGQTVVYADTVTRKDQDGETGEEKLRSIPFLKSYTVFNAEQIEGLPPHFYAQAPAAGPAVMPITCAETFLQNTGATIIHGGNRACYVPSTDNIHMPCRDLFRDVIAYYATLTHEAVHWTRHEKRLHRDFGRKRFGDEGYAMEELTAELGAAFLCSDLGLEPEPRPDHAAYIASWITVLKNDRRAIFTAASHAQRASDYLHGLQPTMAIETSEEPAEEAAWRR